MIKFTQNIDLRMMFHCKRHKIEITTVHLNEKYPLEALHL